MNDTQIITGILKREGWDKYTDHPADRGGPTKWGITLARWRAFAGKPDATVEDLKAVDEVQARAFYLQECIHGPGFDKILDAPLRELLIDAGVNHGQTTAVRWLQLAAAVTPDGILGPLSIAAVNAGAPRALYLWICIQRLRLYGRLVSQDPILQAVKRGGYRLQAENAAGWNNRAAEFLESMARQIDAEHKGGL